MFLAIIGFIAVFIILCSLEANLKTIFKQNDRIIDLLDKQNRK